MTYRIVAQRSQRIPILQRVKVYPAVWIAFFLSHTKPAVIKKIVDWLNGKRPRAKLEEAKAWRNAVNSVSARCAGNGCLQRSLAVVLLARLSGKSITWKAGIRTQPFLAHAWVEAEGELVDEPSEIKDYHVMVASIPA